MSKFQIGVIVVFVAAMIGGVLSFAFFKGGSSGTSVQSVTIWGTFPSSVFNSYISSIDNTLSSSLPVTYVQFDQQDLNKNLINAIVAGNAPDAILVSSDAVLSVKDKLTVIPYTAMPQSTYFNLYIDEARMYVQNNGLLAIPFTIDPLVMYWNRDIYNSAGIATYPKYWDELSGSTMNPGLVQKITIRDQNGNIRRSALAMGDFDKITNAREILGTLLMQGGNPVTAYNEDGNIVSAVSTSYQNSPIPALKFFSQFADPLYDTSIIFLGIPGSGEGIGLCAQCFILYYGWLSRQHAARQR